MLRMQDLLKPIKMETLRDIVVARIEELILSGKLAIGQKLPPERDLAKQLGVSRPVVHEGLVELAGKGLITMKPRHGAVVNDYRMQGSITLLMSLFNYHRGSLGTALLQSMLDLRRLFEVETARRAARLRTSAHLKAFQETLASERTADVHDPERIAAIDFAFHHLVALAGENLIYPLLINSFRPVYTNISFQAFTDPKVIPAVFGLHRQLVQAIADRDEDAAVQIMNHILDNAQRNLKRALRRA